MSSQASYVGVTAETQFSSLVSQVFGELNHLDEVVDLHSTKIQDVMRLPVPEAAPKESTPKEQQPRVLSELITISERIISVRIRIDALTDRVVI